jgi:hypothetical protein
MSECKWGEGLVKRRALACALVSDYACAMGLPTMIGLLAIWAFAGKLGGWGILVGLLAFGLVQLIVGAAVWMNRDES